MNRDFGLQQSNPLSIVDAILVTNNNGDIVATGTSTDASNLTYMKYVRLSNQDLSILSTKSIGPGNVFGLKAYPNSSDVIIGCNAGKYLVDEKGQSCDGKYFLERIDVEGNEIWRVCATVFGAVDTRGGTSKVGIDNSNVGGNLWAFKLGYSRPIEFSCIYGSC
jgi:hypothetical protein